MAGTATSKNNAIMGFPDSGTALQYDFLGNTLASLVPNPTSGTTNLAVSQVGTTTTLTWRRLANNGDANDAQISLTGNTIVIWGFGGSNLYTASPLPAMSWVSVDLAGLATASPSPSFGVSPTPTPTYQYSAKLETPLTLYWNRNGYMYNFKAVLTKIAWSVLCNMI